ncbi:GNAT family N-acetyltransferase [Viscerimonas tarda]
MIQLANNQTTPFVRQMWKTCFGDSDEFMDIYFSRKYKHENTLIYFEEGVAVSSLQLLPYEMRFYGSIVPVAYISGACTLPGYRGKGYMKSLLMASYKLMQERRIPISLLVPAKEWLYGFYAKYGYEKVFDNGNKPINLQPFLSHYPAETGIAYDLFDRKYQQRDFCVLKTRADFEVIMDDCKLSACSPKYDLAGMARIIDAKSVLNFYAQENKKAKFTLRITDYLTENEGFYAVENGKAEKLTIQPVDLTVDIQLLARLVFGYHLQDLPPVCRKFFHEHHPVMNLMLE